VTISAPRSSPNTDGIDVDSCNSVLIRDCNISVGDDGIAIKSGLNKAGRDFNKPSHNIRIENNTFGNNGIAIGSEMSGSVYDVKVDGADFNKVQCAIYVKSEPGRGGLVSDIHFTNIRIKWALQAIRFTMD
jgi:polygalacturonase